MIQRTESQPGLSYSNISELQRYIGKPPQEFSKTQKKTAQTLMKYMEKQFGTLEDAFRSDDQQEISDEMTNVIITNVLAANVFDIDITHILNKTLLRAGMINQPISTVGEVQNVLKESMDEVGVFGFLNILRIQQAALWTSVDLSHKGVIENSLASILLRLVAFASKCNIDLEKNLHREVMEINTEALWHQRMVP